MSEPEKFDEEYQDSAYSESESAVEEVSGEEEAVEDDVSSGNEEENEEAGDNEEEPAPATDGQPEPPKRKRGRPPGTGKKKKVKSGRFQTLEIPLDENGEQFKVENDELLLPADPKGETKINEFGQLQGGREFRVRTFSLIGRGPRLYMLATEPAKCVGFRDSYLLFQRHRKLLKIKLSDEEKLDLVARDIIPHSYKGRAIGVVTARSIYREFGARIIVNGHKVKDDYYEQEAIDAGFKETDLADPSDHLPADGEEYNRNQYVAWFNHREAVDPATLYESNLKSVLEANTNVGDSGMPLEEPKLNPEVVSKAAQMTSEYNTQLSLRRRAVLRRAVSSGGINEPHTGVKFLPELTQPSNAKFIKTGPSNESDPGAVIIETILK